MRGEAYEPLTRVPPDDGAHQDADEPRITANPESWPGTGARGLAGNSNGALLEQQGNRMGGFMKSSIAAFLTGTPVFLAWWGYQTGNDLLLFIGGLVALAPAAALVVEKLKWF